MAVDTYLAFARMAFQSSDYADFDEVTNELKRRYPDLDFVFDKIHDLAQENEHLWEVAAEYVR
jgi:hypothetical protein